VQTSVKNHGIVKEPATINTPSATINGNNDFVNNSHVTSTEPQRNTDIQTTTPLSGPAEVDVASNRKGSVRGFLRKATRVIVKATGIDATNEDDELLIGALAVKLK
jgi:hypothetical protein